MEYLMRLANVVLICLLLGQVRAARHLLATCTAGQEFQLESNGILTPTLRAWTVLTAIFKPKHHRTAWIAATLAPLAMWVLV